MSTLQRITGTNSGLDVDSLVKTSMSSYQSKIDKETQNKKVLEYQQEQYKKIMSDASDFYGKYFDILKTGNLVSASSYQSVSFESGDSSKVTAKGFAGAEVSNYKVTTTQMASKATATFKSSDLSGTNLCVKFSGKTDVSVAIVKDGNGTVDMATTVKNLNAALSKAGINVSAKYSEFSKGIVLESGEMGEKVSFQAGVDNSYKTYTGQNAKGVITKGTETYNFDQASNVINVDNVQFTLNAACTPTSTNDAAVAHLTTTSGATQTSEDANTKTTTVVSADGNTITTTKIDKTTGTITQTLTKDAKTTPTTTTNTYASSAAVSLTGSSNVTDLKDKIVKFIDDYNTLLKEINTKLYEKRDKSYMPLTDAQKKEMTDDQITAWEAKAKTGLLRNDSDLQRIANEMKSAMSSVMSGSGLYLEKIGIKPVKDYSEKNGTYTVDEDKLTQALQENAGNIKDLFTRAESKTDKGGIFTRLASTLKSEFKESDSALAKKAGLDGTSTQYNNTLTKSIAEKKQRIAKLNTQFTAKETALYNKYSALETALEKLTAQQSSLASMLGTN